MPHDHLLYIRSGFFPTMLVIATVKPCHSSFPLSPTKFMIPGEVTAVNVATLHLPLLISCTSALLLCSTTLLL